MLKTFLLLCSESRHSRHVALKIGRASDTEENGREPLIYQKLHGDGKTKETTSHVVQLLDQFIHAGPNGSHLCLVFEPMGSSLAHVFYDPPENFKRADRYTEILPPWATRRLLKQLVRGVHTLHAHQIVHSDLQSGNILFNLNDVELTDTLEQKLDGPGVKHQIVKRIDGTQDPSAPKYILSNAPLSENTNTGRDFVIKLSDLGACMFLVPSQAEKQPRHFRGD